MISRSDGMTVAGCAVMCLLVAVAMGLHIDSDDMSANRSWSREDAPDIDRSWRVQDAPASLHRNTDGISDADIAFILQAIKDSLQRNDLTVARVLLDAVLAIRSDLPQAVALQKDLNAREAAVAAAPTSEVPVSLPTPAAAEIPDRVQEQPAPVVRTQSANGSRRASDRSSARAHPASTGKPHDKTRHAIQVPHYHGPVHVANARPKTRTEVVDELKSARTHGSMPRYGKPDPYQHGGS
ncbi:DUF4148 domain-containing protein [Paraburkholderia sp. LEh10]|uniref:DUF4148 domain-containing protein n=1 Tax=Paraburkholderia sp. LEh10 TaxID=2821353 RepID=UPI001AE33ED2|nr:DUF4148 domain-containing protein [Paraburkholderia sp. LEh10]MBP0589690.1 DUF4148 domain-containing protein [Paraburkholderia sp. LEh10]